jgi:polysaccharide export outer membrane protein
MTTTTRAHWLQRQYTRLLLLCVGALSCTAPAQQSAAAESLGPGDTIRVTVYQNPDLNTESRVSEHGTVVFPLLGEIAVGGQTPLEAGAAIARKLKTGRFLTDPQVTVSLVDVRSRQVSVLGHVTQPGRYPLDGTRSRITDLLAQAGGISESGDETVVLLRVRDGKQERSQINVPEMYRSGDLSSDLELQAGDTLFVPGAPVFYVYGGVQRPGAYRLHEPMTVMNALSMGGGLTPRGSDRKLRIHRRTDSGEPQIIDASLTDPVMPDDVVEVRESIF